MQNAQRVHKGFTLPTVVVASVAMLAMLLMSFQLSAASSNALRAQYYQQLSNTAAEAGVARATECIEKNDGVAAWSDAKPLTASTDCTGTVRTECAPASAPSSCFVAYMDEIRSNYSIGTPDTSVSGYSFSAIGLVNQVNSSGDVIGQAASGSAGYVSAISNVPKIAGGAGWLDYGHIGMFVSVKGQLYGYGENESGQITDNPVSPFTTPRPTFIDLPDGVSTVKTVKTSGQGASFVCIIGNNDQVYCRGSGLNLDNLGWQKLEIPSGWKVYGMMVDGYGDDSVCVLTSTSASVVAKRVMCAGNMDFGRLGNNQLGGQVPMSSPVTFGSNSGRSDTPFLYAEKLFDMTTTATCMKSSQDKNLYCSGFSWFGQLGTASTNVAVPVKWNIPSMGEVSREPVDVVADYHGEVESLHVLANDGTVWSRGDRSYISNFGSGGNTGNTGDNEFPDWFGPRGGSLKMSSVNRCIDVPNSVNTPDTLLWVYDCNDTSAQNFFVTTGVYGSESGGHIFYPTDSNRASGTNLCMDLQNNNTNNGSPILIWYCGDGNPAQQWTIDASGRIHHAGNTSKCIQANSTSSGSGLSIQNCSSSSLQVFNVSEDAKPYKAIIAGNNFFCGVKENSARCGGKNDYGQLMNYVNSSLRDGNSRQSTANTWLVKLPDGETIDVDKLANGSGEWKYQINSLQVITRSGNVYGAGLNTYGKLGSGSTGGSQASVVKMNLPSGVKALDMSTRDEYTTYVLGDDGNVYSMGRNNNGQLGIGSMTPAYSGTPRRVLLNREGYLY